MEEFVLTESQLWKRLAFYQYITIFSSFQGVHLAKPDFCPDFVYPIMKKCWSKEPEQRPFYDTIIDALNGEELPSDTPKAREQTENETQHEYQNFIPYSDKGKDDV